MLEELSHETNGLSRSVRNIDEFGDLRIPQERRLQAFYKAAIAEVDAAKLQDRIAEAKRAVVMRARELFQASRQNFEEEQALDSAVFVLHALHATLKFHSALQVAGNDRKTV